ncbi:MAG TPA: PIN domain-containing protein [Polyangiaceae bacterium]|nr:PIN domain-containing protein [Polyangiaceae bacterium]
MRAVVYDAGVLIAADRNEREVWLEHRLLLQAGIVPLVPAPVVAQVSRAPSQAQFRRILQSCEVVSFDEASAHRAGSLLAKTKGRDVVDAAVVTVAESHGADIHTRDPEDIQPLVQAAGLSTMIRSS